MNNPSLAQKSFRGRDNDVSLNSSTWNGGGGLNGNWTQTAGVNFRVRFVVQESGNAAQNNTFTLMYSKNGGTYTQITASSNNVRVVDSTHYADGDATTQLLDGTGSFQAGVGDDNDNKMPSAGNIAVPALGNTECEINLRLVRSHLTTGDTIALRMYRDAPTPTALESYTNTPTITVSVPFFPRGANIVAPMHGNLLEMAHPLSAGLEGYWLFNMATGNRVPNLAGSLLRCNMQGWTDDDWDHSPNGPAADVAGAAGKYGNISNHPRLGGMSALGCMVFIHRAGVGQAADGGIIARRHSTGVMQWGMELEDVTGVVDARVNTTTSGDFQITGTTDIRDASPHILIFTWREIDGAARLYVDGVQEASGTRAEPLSSSTLGLEIGRNASSRGLTGMIIMAAFWRRFLSPGDVAWLSHDPFAMLRADDPVWAFSSGAAGPVIVTRSESEGLFVSDRFSDRQIHTQREGLFVQSRHNRIEKHIQSEGLLLDDSSIPVKVWVRMETDRLLLAEQFRRVMVAVQSEGLLTPDQATRIEKHIQREGLFLDENSLGIKVLSRMVSDSLLLGERQYSLRKLLQREGLLLDERRYSIVEAIQREGLFIRDDAFPFKIASRTVTDTLLVNDRQSKQEIHIFNEGLLLLEAFHTVRTHVEREGLFLDERRRSTLARLAREGLLLSELIYRIEIHLQREGLLLSDSGTAFIPGGGPVVVTRSVTEGLLLLDRLVKSESHLQREGILLDENTQRIISIVRREGIELSDSFTQATIRAIVQALVWAKVEANDPIGMVVSHRDPLGAAAGDRDVLGAVASDRDLLGARADTRDPLGMVAGYQAVLN